MKTHILMAMTGLALVALAGAQGTRVSERTALPAGDLVPGTDILPIVDISAGTAGSKKITVNDVFTGWGFTAAGEAVVKSSDYASIVALLPAFTGDGGSGGLKGLVPAPATGDATKFLRGDATWVTIPGGGDLLAENNLSDLDDAAAARGNLGLGTAAVEAATAFEGALGNPGTNGHVLSSLTDGTRSWIAAGTGDVTLAGAETLTNKTLSTGTVISAAPTMTLGSDGTGDIYYRASGGALTRLGVGTDGHVLTLASGLPSWAAASGGGGGSLTNFAEAVNTSAPNATVPVASLTATNAATNVDVALVAKGNGALMAQVPNSATAGGNKRGTNAVDWQMDRSSAAQVASGTLSVIAGGRRNTASAAYSAIVGGSGNTISGVYAFGGAGLNNTCSGQAAFMGAGESNTTSGAHAVVGGGVGNTASGISSIISGGEYATTRGLRGMMARASGKFSSDGDAQEGSYLLRITTVNATQTELTSSGGSGSSINRIILPNNHAYKFRGQAIARSSAGNVKSWDISGTIKRGANAAATEIVGTVTVTVKDEDAGASTWALDVDADTTNGSLRIQGTGEASTSVRWLVSLETVEIG